MISLTFRCGLIFPITKQCLRGSNERFLGQELIYIVSYFFALGIFDLVKKYGDIESGFGVVLAPYHYSGTFHAAILFFIALNDRQGHFYCYFGKRRYVFSYTAIRAGSADILRGGLKGVAVSGDVYR